jgi:Holliday junction DNA helicase RuvA
MIARLSGVLIESAFTNIVLDVNGVGYFINIPMSTYDALPREGEKVTLHTHLHVREDALELYGFATKDELDLFALLRSVSGIGPKVALNILSSMSVTSFCAAVSAGDVKMLTRLKGLGKKTAERLVLELKGKIERIFPETRFSGAGGQIPAGVAQSAEEAVLALAQLGFKYDDAAKSVHALAKEMPEKECTAENLIKKAMSSLQ